jgi:hypothetical protein
VRGEYIWMEREHLVVLSGRRRCSGGNRRGGGVSGGKSHRGGHVGGGEGGSSSGLAMEWNGVRHRRLLQIGGHVERAERDMGGGWLGVA